ncbi:BTAD domain-containing putative transcriptional regulator [Actinosynnema sp. NPDC050436]|uniref:AfsR/SARP family transcriptional regulator n=1 Tax=Actinosynnema sp. NPDC050436 TaxID=3155659 RepID=UPI0033FEC826
MVWLRLLGEIDAEVGGAPAKLGSAKQRGVLAALAVEANHVVGVDRLLEHVWGGLVPARARNSLHTYVSGLRAALSGLPDVRLERRSGGYRLALDDQGVDLHRFRHLLDEARAEDGARAEALLERALGLWRGEPVADLHTPWAEGLRATLDLERLAAELDHAELALRRGRHAELLPRLTGRARSHPLDERAAAQLILALYRSDRQADALEHYRQVRARLIDELGTDPGPRLQDLHRQILNADPGLTAPAPDVAAPVVVMPRQLPAPPASFAGRAGELAALTAAADAATPGAAVVISALSGAGGIGKTWLALAWAHRNLERFPDGQLFVDLHGFSPTDRPTAPADALRALLDALGVASDRVPHDVDTQSALYRSLVAERRMLVVLDNAATAEQVAPLLPGGASCIALVTSRNRLSALVARHGARPLPLDVLADTEARALLTTALGTAHADEPAIAELVALCGGFPLALGLIAARLHHLPPAEVVAELRESGLEALDDTDDLATSLPAVLSWSLRRLSEQQRTAFALIGIAPGPDVDLPAAASLIGLPEAQTRKVLRVLEDHSLLDRRPGGRYAMHDLVRAYAATTADTLPDTDRRAALERVVDFHLHTADAADRFLSTHDAPPPLDPPAPGTRPTPLPDLPAALEWLDTHHPHLLAAQHTAAGLGRHQSVWQLARTLYTFHHWRGHLLDELAVGQAALEAAAHLPDPAISIRGHHFVGRAYADLGQHDEAIAHLHQALALAEHHDDTLHRANTTRALARAWEQRGDDHRALEHALLALELYRRVEPPVSESTALATVGWHAAQAAEYDTARTHCRAALDLFREERDPDGEAATLHSLGWIDQHTGHHDRAVEYYEQALTLFRTHGNNRQAAATLDNLGHPHLALGHAEQARASWREALALYREQGDEAKVEEVLRQLDLLDRGTAEVR